MQKSSLAPTPSTSYALHNFGRPDREFKALLYYVPFLPVNLTLFPPTGFLWLTQGRTGRYIRTNVGGIKRRQEPRRTKMVPQGRPIKTKLGKPAPET